MMRTPLMTVCLIVAALAACSSVPPEVTVGRAGDGHGTFLNPDPQAGANGGVEELADDDDDDELEDAPLAAPAPTVTGVSANGCKTTSIGGVPVVARCRRLADHRAVETSKVKKETRQDKLSQRPNAPRGDARYDDEAEFTGEHRLSGWAAHAGPEATGSTFDNVSGLFSDKQSYWMYHRTIPPGSLVEVRANRRKVRLNVYRGDPPNGYHGRVAVLNYPAAARLDMLRRGRARVSMRIIREGPP